VPAAVTRPGSGTVRLHIRPLAPLVSRAEGELTEGRGKRSVSRTASDIQARMIVYAWDGARPTGVRPSLDAASMLAKVFAALHHTSRVPLARTRKFCQ